MAIRHNGCLGLRGFGGRYGVGIWGANPMVGEIVGERLSDNVIELNPRKVFNIEDVNKILPVVKKITEEFSQRTQALITRFESKKQHGETGLEDLEREINETIEAWQKKLERLGARTKGLWLADFDSGDGYFCWKYPEERIYYWHQYKDGFRGRISIEERERILKNPGPELTL